ncbi:hypothetical protein GCM10007301_42880 [Azorhizobium oxalatiphilum]|uniref:Class I SAM-dependent methyltransferase n=1 Tax=Azorhizobium oxalatiphilum TaxID=980631 RepID=A0A917C928_9HYPH|nr:hypothetical protein [Azorhizobium oxalatiphilum]GGF78313.1 hypothetical protein GCM10007301_42880 [Azorhizobium oxalatiphilum]
MVDLVELADHYKTDKGSREGHAHNYTTLYSFLFEQFRNEEFTMLEIGLERGGVEAGASVDRRGSDVPSIRTWLDYFPKASIHGFDLSNFSHIKLDRFQFHRGDLGSVADLDRLAATLPQLKLAIDDGSHASFHQQLAFLKLFDKVQPGGFYVIEDFHWQPPFENALPPCRKTAEVFEIFLRTGVFDIPFAHPDYLAAIAAQIQNVFVHRSNKGGVNDWHFKMVALQKRLEV